MGSKVYFDLWGGSSAPFHPDEDVIALPDNFFWNRTPIVFQICQESRNIGKLEIFPVTGLSLFHGGNKKYYATLQLSNQGHPAGFKIKALWFSPKDTIELPIRDAEEIPDIQEAAAEIAASWVAEENPLKIRKVQFSFLVSDLNRLNTKIVKQLTRICFLVRILGHSATIFIGMGSGYAHRRGRFHINDDQEHWVYNDDGTFCNGDLQSQLEYKLGVPHGEWPLAKDYDQSNLPALSAELNDLDWFTGPIPDLPSELQQNLLPIRSMCAVVSQNSAYTYCINSEIIERNIRKVNSQICYVDQIRDSLVEDGFTGGWERGEALRRKLSFRKTGLLEEIFGDDVESDGPAGEDVSTGEDVPAGYSPWNFT
ncbi:hypothetical protein VE03_10845 [Pseudogymnoascus sp. 23342-1-I1]|nr:hypothetical protein VE03_10845 [Pseudogymnoascus sp. 23342-1-I1]